MIIEVNNNKCKVNCGPKEMRVLDKAFAIRVPGAFFSPQFKSGSWDGKKHFVTEAGYFKTGLLPEIISFCRKQFPKEKIKFEDSRDTDIDLNKLKNIISFKLRENQADSVRAVALNYLEDKLYFPRGILDASTNAGKTYIAAGLYHAFSKQPTILLLNNSTLFDQFKKELPELVGDDYGYVQGKEIHWNKFTMAMVPTLISRIKKGDMLNELAKFKTVIVDECHLSTSASYSKVLFKLFNTTVRVGMSGSPLSHKSKVKNKTVQEFFGNVVHKITSKELEEQGFSSPITCQILKGNVDHEYPKDYTREYERGIVKNKKRNKKVWKKVSKCAEKGRLPFLIIVQRHEHIKQLLKIMPDHIKNDYVVKHIHHQVKGRFSILDEFKRGEVDVLISSMIIKIGQNMPLLRAAFNAGGGDSDINTLQLLGRNKRVHESKKRTYFYDFADLGYYLKRHSKHRINVMKKEGHKVVETYLK